MSACRRSARSTAIVVAQPSSRDRRHAWRILNARRKVPVFSSAGPESVRVLMPQTWLRSLSRAIQGEALPVAVDLRQHLRVPGSVPLVSDASNRGREGQMSRSNQQAQVGQGRADDPRAVPLSSQLASRAAPSTAAHPSSLPAPLLTSRGESLYSWKLARRWG